MPPLNPPHHIGDGVLHAEKVGDCKRAQLGDEYVGREGPASSMTKEELAWLGMERGAQWLCDFRKIIGKFWFHNSKHENLGIFILSVLQYPQNGVAV